MQEWLWLIPALPFAGFLVLALFGGSLGRPGVAVTGVGAIALSAAAAAATVYRFDAAAAPYRQAFWQWFDVAGLSPTVGLQLDGLSLVMVLVITGVGFLIHLYAARFMRTDPGYRRFFAYLNLFVAAMLLLVLADNLLVLLVGWEAVGLCSYLLIGFWYQDPANGRAARKAFLVTRVGDALMVVGIFYLFWQLGTLDIAALGERAGEHWQAGATGASIAAALLLAGALGKSAQLPLQVWLPDAMAGPTPVSALIHAATMVTAGVYLIARTQALFALSPLVEQAVAWLGAATLLIAGCSALVQSDLKRILAYSTISQIGYMFLALGAGAASAAIFHFMTHAFFKALLFLAAGVVLHALRNEHDIHRMGGLWRRLPAAFWPFLIGAASLAALPLVTAGYYSKEFLLAAVWEASGTGPLLWFAGWLGAVLTGLYIFRAVFTVFFGPMRTEPRPVHSLRMNAALAMLAVLAIAGGFGQSPADPFPAAWLTGTVDGAVSAGPEANSHGPLALLGAAASLGGIALAFLLYGRPGWAERLSGLHPLGSATDLLREGWGFDRAYAAAVVRPYLRLAARLRTDPLDRPFEGLAGLSRAGHRRLSTTQDGRLRGYAAAMAAGLVIAIGAVLIL